MAMNCGKNKSWLMMLGCLLPIIALFALPLLGVKSPYLSWLAVLACPLTMAIMMMLMSKDEKGKKCH